jgi:polyadenylate-binding protein
MIIYIKLIQILKIKKNKMSLTRQSILFISGLDKKVNENMLYQLFNEYCVSYIKIAKDHITRESFGYAFIGFKNKVKAEQALQNLNYSRLCQKTLRISWYNREPNNFRNHPENNIFVKNIPKDLTPKEFDEYFSKFGNIISAKIAEDEEGESMGYGFVLYENEENAKKAIAECHGKMLKNKKLFVCQFQKNRPRKPLRFNNLYVRNIPKDWSEKEVRDYFSKYGEISSMLVKSPDPSKLNKNLPEEKRNNIINHKYAFVCYKSLDGPAENAVAKVPYLKLFDDSYNNKIEEFAEILRKQKVKEENVYKCACYIDENNLSDKINNPRELKKIIDDFNKLLDDNDGEYVIRDKSNRIYCCQALKRSERDKKLKKLYERIKKKIKEKYKFCNLYVKNLPADFTDEKLVKLFGKYGPIRSAKVVKNEISSNYLFIKKSVRVFAYVCFYEPAKAQEAKQQLKDKALIVNGPRLYVDYHQNKEERTQFLKLKLIKESEKRKNALFQNPNNFRNFAIVPNAAGIRTFPRGMAPMNMNINMQRRMPFATNMNMRMNVNNMNNMNNNQPPSKPEQAGPGYTGMDKNARTEYYGEKIYEKISKDQKFAAYESYFPKIVGIFLDLSDGVIERLINDDKYFDEQVEETIRLLDKKEKAN